jgi:hypothetical protein
MANTAITNIQLKINSQVEVAATAATADTADLAEVFDITPGKRDGKVLIEINNVSAANGSVTYSIAAGDFWAGKAITGTIAQGKSFGIEVETAKVKKASGKIELTITPATGKKLKTDHTLTLAVKQLS